MARDGEEMAEALADAVRRLLASGQPQKLAWTVAVAGARANVSVKATSGSRTTSTSCFGRESEFLTRFLNHGLTVGWGRSRSLPDSAGAVNAWLRGASWQSVLDTFPFVERNRRALEALAIEAGRTKETQALRWAVSRDGCDLHTLRYGQDDRAVSVRFFGKREQPDVRLLWDETEVAFAPVQPQRFGDLLLQWLAAQRPPSAVDYPELSVHPVAYFYEQGRPVEGEFRVSWDMIERFYSGFPEGRGDDYIKLLGHLRERGFPAVLRAGQSMMTLILSRSRRHGLRPGQPNVSISLDGGRGGRAQASGIDSAFAELSWIEPVCPEGLVEMLTSLSDLPIN